MDSEAESEEQEEEEASEDSESGVASLARASLSSTLKKMISPTKLMKAVMTTLPPIASGQRVPRYSNMPPLSLVKMNLMKILSLANLNLLRLLCNNKRLLKK